MNSSTITTEDGTIIYYKDWGEGPVVTLSHGWPLSSDAWDGQMLYLSQNGFRVIAHDRRGHGRSSQTFSGNNMDAYADDLSCCNRSTRSQGCYTSGSFYRWRRSCPLYWSSRYEEGLKSCPYRSRATNHA